MKRLSTLLILLALPLLGLLAGRLAAPVLARANPIVKTAERIWLEESKGRKKRTLQSEAFRATGMPVHAATTSAISSGPTS